MKNLLLPLKLLAVIWAVFLLDAVIPIDFNKFGLLPRTTSGLVGIFTAPFLHANLGHIISNTVPLFTLCVVTMVFYSEHIYKIIISIITIGGAIEWVFARSAYHIGASGLIYGLVGFLIAYGLVERKAIPVVLSIIIGLYYGTTMWMGMLPQSGNISWEGHLFGAVGGVITAKMLKNKSEE